MDWEKVIEVMDSHLTAVSQMMDAAAESGDRDLQLAHAAAGLVLSAMYTGLKAGLKREDETR